MPLAQGQLGPGGSGHLLRHRFGPLVRPAVQPAPGQSGSAGSGHLLRHRSGTLLRPAVLALLPLSPSRHRLSLQPSRQQLCSLGVTGRGAWPITPLRLLGRSAVCTGSPTAGDCDGLGLTGRTQPGYLPPSHHGPACRSSWAAAGPARCQWDLLPGQPHAGSSWPGACPAHRGRWGVSVGVSSAAAARLGVTDGAGPGPAGGSSAGRSPAGPGTRRRQLDRQSPVKVKGCAASFAPIHFRRVSRASLSLHVLQPRCKALANHGGQRNLCCLDRSCSLYFQYWAVYSLEFHLRLYTQ